MTRKRSHTRRRYSTDSPPNVPEVPASGQASPWWTLDEAGAYLRISSRTTMRRLIREEGLPVVRLGGHGHTVRTRREWIDAWLAERGRQQAKNEQG